MWRGDDHWLLDGCMIPCSSMCSNSWRAMRRWSGGRCQALAWTGDPLVWIWWVTVCFTGWGGRQGLITEGNSASKASYSVLCCCRWKAGHKEATWEMVPCVWRLVFVSTSRLCFISTSSPCSWRKSTPMMGMWVSAMTKIYQNTQWRPKSNVSERVPKVVIEEPLTAQRPKQSCLCFCSVG